MQAVFQFFDTNGLLIDKAVDLATLIVLACTLISVIKYTRETARTNELTIRPFIILRRGDGDHSNRRMGLELHNIGNGPSLDVTMDKITIHNRDSQLDDLTFSKIDIVEEALKISAPNCDPSIAFDAVTSNEEYEYRIRYHDLNGKEYFTTGRLGKNAITFTGTGAI